MGTWILHFDLFGLVQLYAIFIKRNKKNHTFFIFRKAMFYSLMYGYIKIKPLL
jgi:hypothetical protein